MTRPASDDEDYSSDDDHTPVDNGRVARVPSRMGRKQTITQPATIIPHVPSDSAASPSHNPDSKETKIDNSDERQLVDILNVMSNTMTNQAKEMSNTMTNQAKEISNTISNTMSRELSNMARLLMGSGGGPGRNQIPLPSIPRNSGRTYQGPRADRGYNNSGNQGRDWSMVTCYKCGEMGHISRNCLTNVHDNPNPTRMGNNPPTARQNSSNVHSPPMGAPSTN